MQRLIQLRREIFAALLALFLITSACMLNQEANIRVKGVAGFSVSQLQLPASEAELAATVKSLKEHNAISDVRSNLRTDYVFMPAAYLGIAVWLLCLCIRSRSRLRVFLGIAAALQIIPWVLDINENNCLLHYLDTGELEISLSWFKTLVWVKFAIAIFGLGFAIVVLLLRLIIPRRVLSDRPIILPGHSMPSGWGPFPDYRIAKLSAVGFIGLLVGFLILSWHDITRPDKGLPLSNFHEISYQPRLIVARAFGKLVASLDKSIQTNWDSVNVKPAKPATDPKLAEWKNKINEDSALRKTLTGYQRYYEDASPADSLSFTELNKLLHFNFTIESLRKWDDSFSVTNGDQWRDTARFWIKLPGITKVTYTDTAGFTIARPRSDMEFGSRYPAVGLWILFLLVFCSFCFIAISVSLYFKNRVLDIFYRLDGIEGPSRTTFYLVWALTFAAFICMVFIWGRSFNDEVMIKPIFFMRGFKTAMQGVMLIGYLAGACCLAGFLHTASMLGYFARRVKEKTAHPASEKETATAAQNQVIYNQLKKYFDNYLLLAASILSLLVLCTGSLFSTVNSLDFVKLLSDDWGYSPARPDYIYLYGALHSVVLLLAYIPASFSFSEIELGQPLASTPGEKRNWLDLLKTPMSRFGDVLIASSPLLTGILQSLFETMFK
jgi:hypothetical protein